MGSCNSSERAERAERKLSTWTTHKLSSKRRLFEVAVRQGLQGPTPPLSSELCFRRSDGAVQNHAVHEGAVLGVASAGVDEFLTCGEDNTLRLQYIVSESGNFRNTWTFGGHTKAVSRATYGVTTRLIYSCSRDTTIRQWNPSNTSALQVFRGHDLACTALALSKDEKTLCSGSRDTGIRAWDVETGRCTASEKVPRNLVTCLKYLSAESSSSIVQGGEDLTLRVWDAREGGLRPSLIIDGYTFFPLCLDVARDGHRVLTSCTGFNSSGCETKLWDLRNPGSPVREFNGHSQDTTACVFLDVEEGPVAGARGGDEEIGTGKDVRHNRFSPSPSSCRMIATASKDGTIKIYDLASGCVIVDHVEPECGGYTGMAFQRDLRTGHPVLFASTITGALYAYRLEVVAAAAAGEEAELGERRNEEGRLRLRLRCFGFVRGNPIL